MKKSLIDRFSIPSVSKENTSESVSLVQDSDFPKREKKLKALAPSSTMKSINPLGMRVVVRVREEDNKTNTGLYLPEGAKEERNEALLAEVCEVASAIDEDTNEEANVSGVPLGALVLIEKEMGIKVPWDENLRIVETQDVLAIVAEVGIN